MGTSDLNATVEIKSGLQKEPWTWAQTATLSVDENGFRDPEGLGRAGDEPGILDISRIKEMLLATFKRDLEYLRSLQRVSREMLASLDTKVAIS